MKKKHKEKNVFKIISRELEDQNISFSELINQKQELYEKFNLKIVIFLFSFWGTMKRFPKHLYRPNGNSSYDFVFRESKNQTE